MMTRNRTAAILGLFVGLAAPTGVALADTTLVVWTMPHAGNPDWYNAGGEAFAKAHPGVHVKIVSGWIDKLFTLIVGGEPPDVISYAGSQLGQLIPGDNLLKLEQLIERDPSLDLGMYFPNTVEGLKYRGTIYGLPRAWSVVGMWYNVTRFDERGVPYPSDDWTWDDLIRNGKKLTYSSAGTTQPDHWGFADDWKGHHRFPIWILQSGGRFWNDDYTKSLLDSPEAVRGAQFYVDLYHTYNIAPDPLASGLPSFSTLFSEGRVAMLHSTRFTRPQHEDYRFGVGPIAAGPVSDATLGIIEFVGIHPATQHLDLAWELIKFYASPEGFEAGMQLEPRQSYFWGLSPIPQQAVKQIRETDDLGDENWLNLINTAVPAPTFHPSGILAVPDFNLVLQGKTSVRGLLESSVQQWNAQIAAALDAGQTW